MNAEFFKELKALCKKYEASIGGCGCCGSAYGNVGEEEFDDLNVDAKKVRYRYKDANGKRVEVKE